MDRVHFYFDSRVSENDLAFMLEWNIKNNILFQGLSHHPQFDKKCELYQPSQQQLMVLQEKVEQGIITGDYAIQYIEFAVDFHMIRNKTLIALRTFFDKHVADMPDRSAPYYAHSEGTSYYHNSKDKQRLVIYNDTEHRKHPSKLTVHIEQRLGGIKALKQHGLYLIKNIVDFNHEDFWTRRLTLYQPNFTELGKRNSFASITKDRANIKRGHRVWKGVTYLQEFLRNNPHCKVAFLPMTTISAFEKNFGNCLKD
ncbi:MAG: hypothetical protein D4R63_12250 [Methylococcaceae bacterium]|nr:MAG: hypothetical protein D4R63_12250 [Methylococcaceae bacterium]